MGRSNLRGEILCYTQDDILNEIATPPARNDMRNYRTFPLASEANMLPKQRMAKMMNAVFMLSWKRG